MSEALLPVNLDPASVDPNYVITADTYMLYTDYQRVPLKRAAHATSLVVVDVTVPETPVTLVYNVDYNFASGDVDQDAMSKAYLEDPTFTGQLVSYFTMKTAIPVGTKVKLQMNYVTLEMDPSEYTAEGMDGPEPTRKLMADLIEQIDDLQASFNPVTSISTALIAPIKCLPEDRTGTAADNWISEELHSVDTLHSEQIILPANGSFYKHDLAIVVESTGIALVEGVDYVVFGTNIVKTRSSHHTSGVYDAIIITTRNISTTVKISYHAYGGDFSYKDGYETKRLLGTILRFLSGLGYNGGASSNCAELGDVYAIHDLNSGGDTGYHWLSIATLYLDDSAAEVDRSVGTFKVAGITGTNFSVLFEVSFEIDLDHDRTVNPVKFRLLSGNNPTNYGADTYVDTLTQQIAPKVRLIWDSAAASGYVLQFGFPIRTEDGLASVVVENHSTTRSAWTLVTGGEVAFGAQDNDVLLPYGGVWSNDDATTTTLGFMDGLVLFNGYAEMKETGGTDYGGNYATLMRSTVLGLFTSTDLSVYDLRRLKLEFIDRYTNTQVVAEAKIKAVATPGINACVAQTLFYVPDLCGVEAWLIPYGTAPIRIVLVPTLGSHSRGQGMSVASSPMSRFALKSIIAYCAGTEQ